MQKLKKVQKNILFKCLTNNDLTRESLHDILNYYSLAEQVMSI